MACRLPKSLYGHKHAPRQWNIKLCDAIVEHDYVQSKFDYSRFFKKVDFDIVILLVYVDDLIIIDSTQKLVDELQFVLEQNFEMKDLGELRYFLGLEILRSTYGIVLSQRKYAIYLISEVGLLGVKPNKTPIEVNPFLTFVAYDEFCN